MTSAISWEEPGRPAGPAAASWSRFSSSGAVPSVRVGPGPDHVDPHSLRAALCGPGLRQRPSAALLAPYRCSGPYGRTAVASLTCASHPLLQYQGQDVEPGPGERCGLPEPDALSRPRHGGGSFDLHPLSPASSIACSADRSMSWTREALRRLRSCDCGEGTTIRSGWMKVVVPPQRARPAEPGSGGGGASTTGAAPLGTPAHPPPASGRTASGSSVPGRSWPQHAPRGAARAGAEPLRSPAARHQCRPGQAPGETGS
jgi:hypothetical protein